MSCPECFSGHVRDEEPRGTTTQVHGLNTYVSEPANGHTAKGIIVIIPDAFGWEFVNNRLLADHFAEKGDYKVYLPDFFKGPAAPVSAIPNARKALAPGFSLAKLYHFPVVLASMVPTMIGNRIGVTWPGVRDWFAALRLGEGAALPVGAAGYCWGGKHVVLLGAAKDLGGPAGDRPLIDAGFTAHPSLLSLPGDVEALRVPTSFAMAEHDMGLSVAQQQQIKAIVEAKPDKERGEVRTYEGVGHGFSVRADFTNEKVAQQAAEAEHQALDWFNHHFGF